MTRTRLHRSSAWKRKNPAETPHLTSMDWTPSDSSSRQLLFSRGPSVMTGGSAGVAASSSKALPSGAVTTRTSGTFSGSHFLHFRQFSQSNCCHSQFLFLLTKLNTIQKKIFIGATQWERQIYLQVSSAWVRPLEGTVRCTPRSLPLLSHTAAAARLQTGEPSWLLCCK